MTSVSFAYEVKCGPQRVRQLLLDEAFLHAFVDEQHAIQKTVTVDHDRQASTLSWSIRLDGELPGIVTMFVGRTADLHLVFDLGAGKLEMIAKAKRKGTLKCDLRIEPNDGPTSVGGGDSEPSASPGGGVLRIDGRLSVSGAFGGQAESTVRDQVIKPVFREDLVRMLNEWCTPRTGQSADAAG